jgi:hypothetical protein
MCLILAGLPHLGRRLSALGQPELRYAIIWAMKHTIWPIILRPAHINLSRDGVEAVRLNGNGLNELYEK